ncbi:hypothetical protein CL658_03125 [bacterium]|nr:hypothetical protein [bacterium]
MGVYMTSNLFGYDVENSSVMEVVDRLLVSKSQGVLHRVVTLNPEMVVLAERNLIAKTWLTRADTIVADGYGIKWASWVLCKGPVCIVSGIELVFQLLQQKDLTFYFVGSSQDIITNAISRSKKLYPNVRIVGSSHGYFSEFDVPEIINSITDVNPDVIFVGMGFPKQEYFIQTLSQYCSSGIVIGVGGALEVLSGNKKLAPNWISSRGGEWIFRAIQDPKRVFRWKYLFYFIIFTFQHLFSSNND